METMEMSGKIMIYGARSIALGIQYAIKELFPEKEILGFLVSSAKDNPQYLGGLPVVEICDFSKKYDNESNVRNCGKDKITVLIGAPESVHKEIIYTLEKYGFFHYMCIDWKMEEKLMEQYYKSKKRFFSLHDLDCLDGKKNLIWNKEQFCIFLVKSHKDVDIQNLYYLQKWMHTLQAGAAGTNLRIAEYKDNTGENISGKNGNYCELTALYWIWKNVLSTEASDEYYGMFQYRRLLNIDDKDICRIFENEVDVVLPFPTVHEPDIREHYTRYIRENDWHAMLQALKELQPDYEKVFWKLMEQPYLYNYNILIAKKEILKDYCAWLFPILARTEELSSPKGWERNDRYIGYIGENLLTLYFMYHSEQFQIVHTGRKMLI